MNLAGQTVLELADNQDYSVASLHISQSITSVSDTLILFELNSEGLDNKSGTYYLFVTNSSGNRNASGYQVYFQGNPVFADVYPNNLTENQGIIEVKGRNFAPSPGASAKLELTDQEDYEQSQLFITQYIQNFTDSTILFKPNLNDIINKPGMYYLFLTTDQNLKNETGYPVYVSNSGLPVELTQFKGRQNGKQVIIEWETAVEYDNFGFEIQRKFIDEREYSALGFVHAQQTKGESRKYQFTDEPVQFGIYNYRLRQIDTDGQYKIFEAIEIDYSLPLQFQLLQNYPNPFNPSTEITYSLPLDSKISLLVFDLLGRHVRTLIDDEIVKAGYGTAKWDGRDENGNQTSSGQYVCVLKSEKQSIKRKMVLMK